MKIFFGNKAIEWVDRYLTDPRLDSEALLRKRWAWIWLLVTFVFVLITASTTLFVFKAWPLWWFGAVFMAGYTISFPLYRRVVRFDLVINIFFTVITTAAMFAMLQIGGLNTSLGYVFIGMNCAMGSILVGNLRWTIGMFVWYCITILIVGLFQSSLTTPEYVTPTVNTISFVGLAFWINACILFIVILFMKDKSRFEKAEVEKLRKIDEAKTKLFTNVSHEFRTPLTVIKGIAEQMEKHPERWMKTGPGKIRTQSQILLRLVNQMLGIAKIEADEMHLNLIQGNIRKFIYYLAESFQNLAENKGIHLIVNRQKEAIVTDYDPDKIMHVISNLLSNALKFTPAGGRVYVDVDSVTEENRKMVRITVRDTGRGIPKESVGKIFERFYQVPDNYDQTPGTGLGLALASELVKLMGGEIRVKSEEGKGTEFTLVFPVTTRAKVSGDHGISGIRPETIDTVVPKAGNKVEDKNSLELTGDKPLLLIVEDNSDVVEYLFSVLDKQYNITLATNGKTGLEKALEIIPDIILSDVMMPQMDGFEMLRLLKEDIRTDHIPVIILTARGDFDSKLTGLETGADHYLVKPFSEKELLLKLHNLLELRKKMQKQLGFLPLQHHRGATHHIQERQFIEKINTLIDTNLDDEDFGIKEIGDSLNMSRAQLYRKFSALTDKSIGRYLRSYRLHRAKELLETSGKNVSEAALETGFKNLSHFSTSFREEFGFPPGELL